LCFFF